MGSEYYQGKIEVLEYLIQVAQETNGSGVWRSLFAELRQQTQRHLDAQDIRQHIRQHEHQTAQLSERQTHATRETP